LNYRYLPKKRISDYIYNVAIEKKLERKKKLSIIVPYKGDPKQYNRQVTKAVIEEFKLHQYQID